MAQRTPAAPAETSLRNEVQKANFLSVTPSGTDSSLTIASRERLWPKCCPRGDHLDRAWVGLSVFKWQRGQKPFCNVAYAAMNFASTMLSPRRVCSQAERDAGSSGHSLVILDVE